jgi:xylulokinase
MKFRRKEPTRYQKTWRISLASSFLASLFLGRMAPIDISDVCGMNLWDIKRGTWSRELLAIVGGDADELERKLGGAVSDGGAHLGFIHRYFVTKYGFPQGSSHDIFCSS